MAQSFQNAFTKFLKSLKLQKGLPKVTTSYHKRCIIKPDGCFCFKIGQHSVYALAQDPDEKSWFNPPFTSKIN